MTVTLFSPINERKRANAGRSSNAASVSTSQAEFELDLAAGVPGAAPRWPFLSYGSVYVGKDLNWFMVHGRVDDRSVIQDLGKHDWTDSFKVPIVPPLPELKPGEQRHLIIDGRPYDPNSLQARSSMQGVTSARSHDVSSDDFPQLPPAHPVERKASVVSAQDLEYSARVLAKVVVNHLYVVHVVNAQLDFYVLVHVDALVKGDNCTLSWQRVSDNPPVSSMAQGAGSNSGLQPTELAVGQDQEPATVTFYSPQKYKLTNASPLANGRARSDVTRACFDFASGKFRAYGRSNLSYGLISIGQGTDWFMVHTADDQRTAERRCSLSRNKAIEIVLDE
jgi:hypothetical protein